jgi:CATRA-Associated Small Protein
MTGERGKILTDVLDVLSDMPLWQLPQTRWAEIAGILDSLGTGLDLADQAHLGKLEDVTAQLELAGPVRGKIDKAAGPIPDVVLDRVNRLVYELAQPEETGSADDAGGKPEGSG